MTEKQQRSGGFTLVELVMVTAVLSVLAGLLMVTLSPARKMARVNTCASNLRQIGIAFKMYVADYGTYPPPVPALLDHYTSGSQVFVCPEDTIYVPKGAASSYLFHYFVPPDFTPITQFHELDPGVVLLSCMNHMGQRAVVDREGNTHLMPPAYPFHLALRADGAVRRIPLDRVKQIMRGGSRPVACSLYPGEPGYDKARN